MYETHQVKKVKVENKVLNTHGPKSPDVGKDVSSMDTSKRTLAEANRKGTKFQALSQKFYPKTDGGTA